MFNNQKILGILGNFCVSNFLNVIYEFLKVCQVYMYVAIQVGKQSIDIYLDVWFLDYIYREVISVLVVSVGSFGIFVMLDIFS